MVTFSCRLIALRVRNNFRLSTPQSEPTLNKATTMDNPFLSRQDAASKFSGRRRQPQKIGNWKRGGAKSSNISSSNSTKNVPQRKQRKPVKAQEPKRKQQTSQQHKKQQQQQQQQEEWSVEISKESIASYPVITWDGPTKVLRTAQEMKNAVQEILASGERHLGFDTETKPNYIKGRPANKTALVQLGTASTVYLFHISNLNGHNLDALLPIFTNENITKTGISIHNDVKELQQIQSFRAAGFVDTSIITRDYPLRIKNTGLQALTAHFMAGHLVKSKKCQMSNWATADLSPSQIIYAATDAWVSREVHIQAQKAVAAAATEKKSSCAAKTSNLATNI